ncbi:MAG: anaerobic ribonucleoside-triphosphate reductase activating protein [Ruminococcaceae bacterium]|nr:anaerobic ribonucleoside-triphosphate reductase activating protein [Oscillospiraceae bacterium]
MNYGHIKNCDIANGEGVRVSLFVSGCTNRCKDCFQPETWDFNFGQPYTQATEDEIINMLEPAYINGLTLLGGEPFEPENQRALVPLVKKVKILYPTKTVWAYTGFTLDQLLRQTPHPRCEVTQDLLFNIDVLVDGKYEADKKNISLKFRGSENQRLIDLPKTFKKGNIVLWDK